MSPGELFLETGRISLAARNALRNCRFAPRGAAAIALGVVAAKQDDVLSELGIIALADLTDSTGLRMQHLVLHIIDLERVHLDTLSNEARRRRGTRTIAAQT